jgi:anaerobic ribonucleoside-triphosphate reductase activating protein
MAVTGPDINNGPGFRVTIWVSGCTHACPGCQNKHTWKYGQGHKLDDMVPYHLTCKEKILNLIGDEHIDGVTISGGDPLDQSAQALKELAKFLSNIKKRYPKKSIWLYTGYLIEDLNNYPYKEVIKNCDVIIDGPYVKEKRNITIPFRGSTNQRIIDVQKSFKENKICIIDDSEFVK